MPKEEWGVKRLCPNCSTRFYDLQKDPMTCPLCGHEFDLEALLNPKGRSAISKKDESAPEADVTDDIDDTDVLDDEDTDVDLGDDLLEEEDDDTVSIEEIADVPTNDEES
jgi:uncharacterized protein (TIGR02300 family)